jgi:calcineurin-like phosphoesterase family protein
MQNDVRNKNYTFQSSKNIFFTSDTHFGHQNIIRYCDRPFESVDEMNKELIKRWNDTVKPNDIVFHLGDVAFGGSGLFEEIIPQLNGQKYWILGNHDYKNIRPAYRNYFVDVNPKMFISIDGQPIILNHEPLLCFGGQTDCRIWQLFGHVHTSHNASQGADFQLVSKMCTPSMYDVGVDFNDYKPIKYQDLKQKIDEQIRTNRNYIQCWM